MTVRSGLVSTIIPVYNRARLVREAVASVLAQTYRPIEIVLIDDGSTDESAAVCRELAAAHPDVIRFVQQVNQGPGPATNAGLAVATGAFIQFLDSDDILMPGKFATQVAALESNPDCGISYGMVREYVMGGRWIGQPARRSGMTFEQLFPALLAGKIWPMPSALYRRRVVEESGWFMASRIYQDWEFECRAAVRGVRLHHCRDYVADVRGTHAAEGRTKGGASGDRLVEYATVLTRILEHARAAQVERHDLPILARRLFGAARKCAAGGYESEGRRLLMLAFGIATPMQRLRMRAFEWTAGMAGWPRASSVCERALDSEGADAIRAIRKWPRAKYALWRYRLGEARDTIRGRPPGIWPRLLWDRWTHRRSKAQAA